MTDSRISGLYRKSLQDRLQTLVERGFLTATDAEQLRRGATTLAAVDKMAENVVSVFGLPMGVAPNFLVDGRDYVVPMVVEEPSVIAGVSAAAALIRRGGGFETSATESLLYGQVQLIDIADIDAAASALRENVERFITSMNESQPRLVARGGGVREIEFLRQDLADGPCLVAMIAVDTCDAMGANLVNTLCEFIAPAMEDVAGGRACLRILSNLADRSLVTARCKIPLASLKAADFSAEHVRDNIVAATELALTDPHRAATHNKGVMNGVDALVIATGNDWRAVEAGVHAFAAADGQYRSVTHWKVTDDGDLAGEITLPLKLGIVGGSLQSNPAARIGLQISGVESAAELASLACAVGLAQNFAALRALSSRGIQAGHMHLHARSVASLAGATPEIFDRVVTELVESGEIKDWKARELVAQFRRSDGANPASAGSAAGKVILFGEHAVVYGRHAVALPLPGSISATAGAADKQEIRVPAWPGDKETASAMRAMLRTLLELLEAGDAGVRVDVHASIPPGMGLGASAALAAATCRALADYLGLNLDDARVNELAYECEKLAHGTPSGIDNTLAVYQRPLLFAKNATPQMQDIEVPPNLPLIVAWGREPGSTLDQVSKVRARHTAATDRFERLFDQFDEIAIAGVDALRRSDWMELGDLMNVNHGLLNAIGVSTPELEQMIAIARGAGALGAKLTGGGGGGAIIALCPGCEDRVTNALQSAGYKTLRAGTQ